MKTKTLLLIVLTVVSPMAIAQRVQHIPDNVTVITLSDYQHLRLVPGNDTRIETQSDLTAIGSVSGNTLTLRTDSLVLRLAPSRSLDIVANDYARVDLDGSFPLRDRLSISAADYAHIHFRGTTADTVRVKSLSLHSHDFSRISADAILQCTDNYNFKATDFSRIVLAGLDVPSSFDSNDGDQVATSDFGRVYRGRQTVNGQYVSSQFEDDDSQTSQLFGSVTDALSSSVSGNSSKGQKKSEWDFLTIRFDAAFHNWGDKFGAGFDGVSTDAAIKTSFSEAYYGLDLRLLSTQHFACYLGVGWTISSYMFNKHGIVVDESSSISHFSTDTSNSVAKAHTGYLYIPLSLHFGNPHKFHFALTANFGIHFDGKSTRLVSETILPDRLITVTDYSFTKYVNPYKIDLRASLYYGAFGIFAQTSLLSAFRDNFEKLYPVSFGFTISL